jgi:hypothetical protein
MSMWGRRLTFWKMVSAFAPHVMCIGAFADLSDTAGADFMHMILQR